MCTRRYLELAFPDPMGFADLGSRLPAQITHFGEVVLDDPPNSQVGAFERLRPLLDHIANAGGRPRAPTFDGRGKYIRPR